MSESDASLGPAGKGHRDGLEIERVFLLRGMPPLPASAVAVEIEQGYLPPPDGPGQPEGRLRRQVAPDGQVLRVLTRKHGQGLVRREEERPLSPEEFDRWWPRTAGRRLRKRRHRVPEDGLVWEIDRFEGIELVLAEVELPSAETAIALPAWLAPVVVREVTEDPRYRNFEIARRSGVLPDHPS